MKKHGQPRSTALESSTQRAALERLANSDFDPDDYHKAAHLPGGSCKICNTSHSPGGVCGYCRGVVKMMRGERP